MTTAAAATDPPATMSQAEFARHINVGKSYVTALKKAGRLVLDPDNRVRVAESKQRIAKTQGAPERGAVVTEPFSEARERKEQYQAENARLDFEERCGRLTDARAVDASAANAGVLLRKRLEAMADALAPGLAAASSEDACKAILSDWAEAFLAEASVQLAGIGSRARASTAQKAGGVQ